MTVNHEFDRQLADWLHESSAHRVPDHVIDVLLVTRATRQRPWWSSLGRWLPMQVSVRTRPFVPPNLTRLLILAILIVALAGLALWFAGTRQPRLPAPFGPPGMATSSSARTATSNASTPGRGLGRH